MSKTSSTSGAKGTLRYTGYAQRFRTLRLTAKLLIKQAIDPANGIYTNIGYVVVEVYDNVPRMRQTSLPSAPPE
jgi:hypothetical protein